MLQRCRIHLDVWKAKQSIGVPFVKSKFEDLICQWRLQCCDRVCTSSSYRDLFQEYSLEIEARGAF